MTKSRFKNDSNRVEQYLSETNRAQTTKEIAEGLEMTTSSAYNTLQLMEVFGTVQKVKRGAKYYYFLNGIYDEEQISAMLPPERVKPRPRRRSILQSPRGSKALAQISFLEEHLSTIRERASSYEGPSALAMIGLKQIDLAEDDVVLAAELILKRLDVDVEEKERTFETPKKIEPFATVGHLPKDVRPLTQVQAKHLKEQLKGLDGYDRIERFKMAFADFSALENGSYGTIFYFSMGTNPWERVHRVKVDAPISLETEKPVKRLRRKRRSKYDPILDQFLELGQDLAEINVKGKTPSYVRSQLRRRIEDRGLEVTVSSAGDFVYLERKR